MRRLPKQQSVGKCTQWALGCGAVFLSTRAVLHGLDVPTVIAAIAVGTAGAAAAAASSVLAALPDIIAELRAKKVACIKAKTDARVALEGARRRTAVVNAALNGKLEAAVSLLKLLMLDDQVHARRQLGEDMLRELLPQPRVPHEEDARLAVIEPRKHGASP